MILRKIHLVNKAKRLRYKTKKPTHRSICVQKVFNIALSVRSDCINFTLSTAYHPNAYLINPSPTFLVQYSVS